MEKRIGVIGAGVMGRGVALRFATNGYDVVLIDINQNILNDAIKEINQIIRLQIMFQNKLDTNKIIERIQTSLDYHDLQNVDYIIENVPEIIEEKKRVYSLLEDVCHEKCIFLANTSCIPITSIGAMTKRANQVIGVHFMNPVHLKNFAEVIRGRLTSDDAVFKVTELLTSINIESEVIKDGAGFVSNRLSHLYMNEAAFLVYEGIATPKQIDNIFKKAFSHKMGPLETADLIGIDTVIHSLNILYTEYQDAKFRVCPLLKQMDSSGELGRKSGKGFYDYK